MGGRRPRSPRHQLARLHHTRTLIPHRHQPTLLRHASHNPHGTNNHNSTRQNNIFITNRPSLASQCHTIPGLGDHYAISIHSSAQAHRTKPASRKIHLRQHADIDNLKQDARSFTSSFTQTFTIDSIHTTRCSMRETRETVLLHAWVQSPIRPHNHRQLHQFIACIFI